MATSATSSAAVRAAFSGLIDYAGLFPPAQLAMEPALAEYAAARRGPHAWMLARFIVPESRLAELLECAREPIPLSVIIGTAGDSRTWFAPTHDALRRVAEQRTSGVTIEALEVPLPRTLSQRETYDAAIGQYSAVAAQAGLGDLPSYMELPQDDRRDGLLPGALAAMKRQRLHAKLRCGGMTAAAFPTVSDIAKFLSAAAGDGVAFKATAGLHHPLRGYNEESGFVMHGFLNLLVAAALARQDASEETILSALGDEDAGHFALQADGLRWRTTLLGADALNATRARSFTSYGSCSFREPVDDLAALGLIE